MRRGKALFGLILIAVAIWMLISIEDNLIRYLGGIIVAIVGLFFFIPGLKGGAVKRTMKPVNRNPVKKTVKKSVKKKRR